MTESSNNFKVKKSKYFSEDDIVQGPKKFVFQIYPENVKFIESLSYQEKQDLINHLISESRNEINEKYKYKQHFNWVKKAIITVILILIGIPLLFYLASISLNVTKTNYSEMQSNFEKLF
ncbi:MAG: hypothetical protein A2104_05920 [Candidatus Melainabacteria bacterium GWF2_32_7]|nr:MAG: hypothetical protein A2104_05920 [Candidatus Melainabacteria bacterium GWF2_32_7]